MFGILKDAFTEELQNRLTREEERTNENKVTYAEKVETADTPAAMFKYFLLISVSQIESYVAQTRSQAQLTFGLCKRVASGAFIIIALGVLLAIGEHFWGNSKNDYTKDYTAAWLTALSGILTQMISSVFFYFYNRTLEQFNLLSDKLTVTQDTAISLLASSHISDVIKRDDCNVELIKLLLARVVQKNVDATPSAIPLTRL
jgi:hypothetical protein